MKFRFKQGARGFIVLLTLLFVFTLTAFSQKAPSRPNPCLSPEAQAFDFMVGKWEGVEKAMVNGKMTDVSTSEVQIIRVLNSCALQESWNVKADGKTLFTAILLRSYDAGAKKWFLSYVDDGQNHQFYEGRFDSNQWRFFRERIADGKPVLVRITWSSVSKDRFEQTVERSQDGGKSWELRSTINYTRSKR